MHYAGGNGLTICGFLSHQRLSLSNAVGGIDRNLVSCLWGQPLKHGGGDITRHCFLPSLIGEQGFPGDPVIANIARCCSPEDSKAGLGDILCDQVFRRAKHWQREACKNIKNRSLEHIELSSRKVYLIQGGKILIQLTLCHIYIMARNQCDELMLKLTTKIIQSKPVQLNTLTFLQYNIINTPGKPCKLIFCLFFNLTRNSIYKTQTLFFFIFPTYPPPSPFYLTFLLE